MIASLFAVSEISMPVHVFPRQHLQYSKCLTRNLLPERSRCSLHSHYAKFGPGWGGGVEGAVNGRMSISDTCIQDGENVTTKTWIGLVLKSAYKNRISVDMNSCEDFRSMNCTPPVSPRLSPLPYPPPSPQPSEDLRSPHFGVSCSL